MVALRADAAVENAGEVEVEVEVEVDVGVPVVAVEADPEVAAAAVGAPDVEATVAGAGATRPTTGPISKLWRPRRPRRSCRNRPPTPSPKG